MSQAGLTAEKILELLKQLSDELGSRFQPLVVIRDIAAQIPIKARYLVEGLFADNKI